MVLIICKIIKKQVFWAGFSRNGSQDKVQGANYLRRMNTCERSRTEAGADRGRSWTMIQTWKSQGYLLGDLGNDYHHETILYAAKEGRPSPHECCLGKGRPQWSMSLGSGRFRRRSRPQAVCQPHFPLLSSKPVLKGLLDTTSLCPLPRVWIVCFSSHNTYFNTPLRIGMW